MKANTKISLLLITTTVIFLTSCSVTLRGHHRDGDRGYIQPVNNKFTINKTADLTQVNSSYLQQYSKIKTGYTILK